MTLEPPETDPRFEALPPALEGKLATAGDESPLWQDLAQELARVRSPRAKAMRGDEAAQAQLAPSVAGEQLALTWQHGYVRAMSVEPAPRPPLTGEAQLLALTAFLRHPSLRFLQELTLAGDVEHAKAWLEVLARAAPPALRRVTVPSVPATDPVAAEISFRFPRWTWAWGQRSSSSSLLRRLFGR